MNDIVNSEEKSEPESEEESEAEQAGQAEQQGEVRAEHVKAKHGEAKAKAKQSDAVMRQRKMKQDALLIHDEIDVADDTEKMERIFLIF